MRDIKFRAWFDGHMYEVAKLDFWGDPDQATCDMAGPGKNGAWEELFDIYVGEVELMQYTGLKDKNGKEIYEGDICNCREYECFGKVEWNNEEAGFYFCVVLEGGGFEEEHLYDYADELEVIGNIFENPEMLREEQK